MRYAKKSSRLHQARIPDMSGRERRWIVVFVGLSYGMSWAIWWIGMLVTPELAQASDGRYFPFLLAGSFAPSASALLVAGYTGGFSAIKGLLNRLVRVRVNWMVYVATFFVLPVLGIATLLGVGVTNKIELSTIAITAIALMPVNALLGGVVFGIGPLGEEMGWRGFLQDRLQGRGNSAVIAIVVGVVWSVWHAPIAVRFDDFRSGLSLLEFAALYPVFTILLAFILGHLWRWSHGSLVIAIFFHAVSNMAVDIYLTNTAWWDFGDRSPLQIYLVVLFVYALCAGGAEIASRTIFRGLHRPTTPNSVTDRPVSA